LGRGIAVSAMAEQQDQHDKSEKATPFKLLEARKRGQVAKSMEVNSFLILSTFLICIHMFGESMIMGELKIGHALVTQASQYELNVNNVMYLYGSVFDSIMSILWPMLICIIVIALMSTMFQTGPVFSFFPLKPDIQRLNPIQGFKRLFSIRLLYESVKNIIKLGLFGAVIGFFITNAIPYLVSMLDKSPDIYPLLLLREIKMLIFKLLLVILIIAIIDLMYTRWDFAKKMRMSRRDIKDEVKRRDGDPHVKSKQKELQKEASKRAGLIKNVPDADVLITNPTHFSVAISYKKQMMAAPVVIAKGAGEMALQMRTLAKKHSVPIVENKKLARYLFRKVGIEQAVPIDQYALVAKILAWAYMLKTKPA